MQDRMSRSDDPNDYVVHDPLLEKGKEKFNKMQAKQKRREREWAGKSLTWLISQDPGQTMGFKSRRLNPRLTWLHSFTIKPDQIYISIPTEQWRFIEVHQSSLLTTMTNCFRHASFWIWKKKQYTTLSLSLSLYTSHHILM